MRKIGEIVRLQVQPTSLKQGERSHRYYEPAGLCVVTALRLTAQGVVGLLNGAEVSDVHHAEHPASKNRGLTNSLSINFTSHYAQMQGRFGDHLSTGCAGENILVSTDEAFDETALVEGVMIETQDGQQIHLTQICVADPCAPFSEYALHLEQRPPAELLKATLQFLDGGMRGFYCQLTGEPAVIQVGDTLFV
ncbi:MAG: hypothetical protein M3Q45_15460 [Chloroflexota bacterium]|nr:hypothetical protein [Chloroflexota bacterium]